GDWYNFILVSTDNGYVRIEGIEIDGSNVSGGENIRGIMVNDSGTSEDVRISHNLIHDITNSTADTSDESDVQGIYLENTTNTKISNNIIYNLTDACTNDNSNPKGIESNTSGKTHYVYNNTIYNIKNNASIGTAKGISDVGGSTIVAKNNYVGLVDSTNGSELCFSGTFSAEDYNVASDTSPTGSNSIEDQSSYATYFISTTGGSEDLHLKGDSNALWGTYGLDLDADPNLPVTDDIDGGARDASTPDIGADEYVGGSATALYRSVGITATDLNTSPRTVEISGSTATFSGDMPTHVGVGDVLAYNNGSDRIAFIHGRSSATVFTVKDKDGSTPATASAETSVGVYRAYTSLSNWESQTQNANITEPSPGDVNPSPDLVTANTIMMVACYGDGEDAASAFIDSWTTGPDNYIKIYTPVSSSEVGTSQRHNGRWDTSAYRISMDGTYFAPIGVRERYVRIDGLQIDSNVVYTDQSNGIHVGDGEDPNDAAVEIHISNSIFRMTAAPLPLTAFGIGILNSFGDVTSDNSLYVAKVWNNIIYGYAESDGAGTCMYADDYGTVYAYNNTCVGGNGATSKGIAVFGGALDFYAKNNISIDSNDPYQNAFHTDSTDNVSDTGDAPGSNPVNGEPTFVNKTGNNYRLASSDTVAQGAGADLDGDSNLAITDDIEGDARDATQPDIGADEYSAAVDLAQIHYRWRDDTGAETGGTDTIEESATASDTLSVADTYTQIDSMSIIPGAGDYLVWFSGTLKCNSAGSTQHVSLFVDTSQIGLEHTEREITTETSIANTPFVVATHAYIQNLTAGQAINVRWKTTAITATMLERTLVVTKVNDANVTPAIATNTATTTNTDYEQIDTMAVTPGAGDYLIWFSGSIMNPTDTSVQHVSLFVNTSQVGLEHTEREIDQEDSLGDTYFPVATHARVTGIGATDVINVRWKRDTGTATMKARTLTVYKINAADTFQNSATADTNTTSTSYTQIDSMARTPGAGNYHVWFSASLEDPQATDTVNASLFVNDSQVGLEHTEREIWVEGSLDNPHQTFPVALHAYIENVGASDSINVRWKRTGSGTVTMHERTLVVESVPVAPGSTFAKDENVKYTTAAFFGLQ
ncbi:MAG: hypothetical protein ACYTGS_11740, partial [Planctomycetota bacterium]